MKHFGTVALVCLLVLAAWCAGLFPAQRVWAFGSGGGGGSGGNCGLSHWANLPATPTSLACFSIPDAASCTAGTPVTTSGSTPCQLTWNGSNWVPAGNATASGSTSGTVNNSAQFNLPYYSSSGSTNVLSGASIATGSLIKSTASGPAAAVSGTDYQPPIAGNTLASHNFANSIGTNGAISGAQPAFTDVSGIATVAQGGTQCGAPSSFASLPGSPTAGQQCSITDAPVCGANAIIAAGGGALPCLLTYNGTNWVASGGSTGIYQHITNNGTTGTSAFHLFTRDSSNNAVSITAGATAGAMGICINSCGTTGSGNFLVTPADATCTFDGAHTITRNDYIGISATVTGDCTDLGSTPAAGQQIIGQVEASSGTGPGNFTIYYYGPAGSSSNASTPGGSTGAVQYNNAGALAGAVITGLVKGNGTSAPTAAVSGTDFQPPIAGNTLASHNFANSISSAGAITGAQPAFTDISGTAQVAQGGTGHTAASAAAANAIGAAELGVNSSITQFTGITTPISTAQGGNGTNYGSPATNIQLANNGSTAPVVNELVTITGAPSTATVAPAGTTKGIQGICIANCSTSGNATIQTSGLVSCVFDNATTAGDYVVPSSGTAGNCHDTGVSQSTSMVNLGTIYSTNGAAGTYQIQLGLPTDAVGSGGTGINTGVLGNSPLYAGTAVIGPVNNEIHGNTSTLAAALAAVTQTTWAATTSYISGQLLYDGTNTERIADWQPSTAYTSSSILVPFNGNNGGFRFTQSAATCTGGAAKPTWPQTGGNTVTDGTCTWHNTGSIGCTSGSGSHPTWSGSLGGVVNDNTCPWMNYIAGAAAPSVQSNVVLDPGKVYTVSQYTLIGGTNLGQTLDINGATVSCSGTGGVGTGCLVAGNWSKIIGSNRNASFISTNSAANIDSLLESNTAYAYEALNLQVGSTNMDVEHVNIIPGPSTIQTAALWISGIDGLGNFDHIFVGGSTATSIPNGILVDDAPTGSSFTGMFWNELDFRAVWVGVGTDVHGVNILCGQTTGSSGSNLLWSGGPITDGRVSATVDNMNINGGSNGGCTDITLHEPYFESFGTQTGNFIDISGAGNVNIEDANFNGGPTLTNCIAIANVAASGVRVTGSAHACTNIVTNSVTGQPITVPVSGSQHKFTYNWDNPTFSTGPINQIGGLINPWGPGGPAGLYYSAAGTPLPACSASYARYIEDVSDATACNSGTTYASGGGTCCEVQCNTAGSAWKETGKECF